MENLVQLYAKEVADGRMKIDHVPKRLQEQAAAEAKKLKAAAKKKAKESAGE